MIATLVGSREISEVVGKRCTRIGYMLAELGIEMYSGKAGGADLAFYQGYLLWHEHTKKPIRVKNFLPWKGFNDHVETKHDVLVDDEELSLQAAQLASKIHPAWFDLKRSHKLLHLRNMFQVFGPDLRTENSDFCLFAAPEIRNKVQGGTSTAVNTFRKFGLPNHNILESRKKFDYFMDDVLSEVECFIDLPDFEDIGGDVRFWENTYTKI